MPDSIGIFFVFAIDQLLLTQVLLNEYKFEKI